jgi:hypothetical protein
LHPAVCGPGFSACVDDPASDNPSSRTPDASRSQSRNDTRTEADLFCSK